MMRTSFHAALWFAAASVYLPAAARADTVPAPIPVRVVVVTTFELGADTGDAPGEFQNWVERFPLAQTLPFPQGYRHLRYDPDRGVLGIVTGEGAEHGAASIMGLGLDSRFDLSHAYWVIAAIAGVDPVAGSVGSAAWARYVVNTDLAYDVDARDIPASWSTGLVPLGMSHPFARPVPAADRLEGITVYPLNAALADWAYRETAHVPLPDDAMLRTLRKDFTEPAARRPPFVFEGDDECGDRFWLGPHMTRWAERWMTYWTHGRGTFAMTAEEDAGIMQAIKFLGRAHRVDPSRVMVLRTASDYTRPRKGETIGQLLAADAGTSTLSAYRESLEAAYRVGSVVVNEIATHWDRYEDRTPAL